MLALCVTVLSIMSCTGRLLRTAYDAVSLGHSNTQFHRIAMSVRSCKLMVALFSPDFTALIRRASTFLLAKLE